MFLLDLLAQHRQRHQTQRLARLAHALWDGSDEGLSGNLAGACDSRHRVRVAMDAGRWLLMPAGKGTAARTTPFFRQEARAVAQALASVWESGGGQEDGSHGPLGRPSSDPDRLGGHLWMNAFEAAVLTRRATEAAALWRAGGDERFQSHDGRAPSALVVWAACANAEVFLAVAPYVPEHAWGTVPAAGGKSAQDLARERTQAPADA